MLWRKIKKKVITGDTKKRGVVAEGFEWRRTDGRTDVLTGQYHFISYLRVLLMSMVLCVVSKGFIFIATFVIVHYRLYQSCHVEICATVHREAFTQQPSDI